MNAATTRVCVPVLLKWTWHMVRGERGVTHGYSSSLVLPIPLSLSLSAGPAGVGPWFIDVWWDRHSCCRGLYKCKEAVSVCFIRRTTDEGQVEKSTAVCGAQKKLETKIENRAKAHRALPLTPSPAPSPPALQCKCGHLVHCEALRVWEIVCLCFSACH